MNHHDWLAPGTQLTPDVCSRILRDLFSRRQPEDDAPPREPVDEDTFEQLCLIVDYLSWHVVDTYPDILVQAMAMSGCRGAASPDTPRNP